VAQSLLETYFCLLRQSGTNDHFVVRCLVIRKVYLICSSVKFRVRLYYHITLFFGMPCCSW
jgi:hypothetical protein